MLNKNQLQIPLDITTDESTVEAHPDSESHNGQDFEASGEDYAPITETSPVYTSQYDVGCRGDTTFTCPESGKTICEEQLCDGEEQCPDGEDEMHCRGEGDGNENNGYDGDNEYEPGTVFVLSLNICVFLCYLFFLELDFILTSFKSL